MQAVEAARAFPGIDPARTVVTGTSQGGGITLAAAGLIPDLAETYPTSRSWPTSPAP